jgi:hypothetical protein
MIRADIPAVSPLVLTWAGSWRLEVKSSHRGLAGCAGEPTLKVT